jgi:hypothetical protein
MSQQRCSSFQKLYLELLNSSGDDPYIFEKVGKFSTSFVYHVFPDSVFNLAEKLEIPDLSRFWSRTETSEYKYHNLKFYLSK